ncbi:hypothetical protein GCM10010156_48680 [Planobispora rosea]|uniref:Uncharacterized protein n=1 Tax=Planobispora rosea TaxID=35762 RepID=A0A8J3S7I4_PLARO|nr:hypothetical protein GCM10010156_48680 [Planobispora rosea]GIH86379.1 hypothetical protein Pro02_47870 [Planobispora rosea]
MAASLPSLGYKTDTITVVHTSPMEEIASAWLHFSAAFTCSSGVSQVMKEHGCPLAPGDDPPTRPTLPRPPRRPPPGRRAPPAPPLRSRLIAPPDGEPRTAPPPADIAWPAPWR